MLVETVQHRFSRILLSSTGFYLAVFCFDREHFGVYMISTVFLLAEDHFTEPIEFTP